MGKAPALGTEARRGSRMAKETGNLTATSSKRGTDGEGFTISVLRKPPSAGSRCSGAERSSTGRRRIPWGRRQERCRGRWPRRRCSWGCSDQAEVRREGKSEHGGARLRRGYYTGGGGRRPRAWYNAPCFVQYEEPRTRR
ncbi:putative classical arabinogalactan protein 9 [Iris pallida]|uniref:Classical arabinogalactan protein 9 n=1 Tax=Iris pallida TaxID=29817 RepID=A0AAX6EEC7_IRIPA|nr:putative classical arabinogalactan protein 9 [Iris pallida]